MSTAFAMKSYKVFPKNRNLDHKLMFPFGINFLLISSSRTIILIKCQFFQKLKWRISYKNINILLLTSLKCIYLSCHKLIRLIILLTIIDSFWRTKGSAFCLSSKRRKLSITICRKIYQISIIQKELST